jgi:hypothetical protein
MKTLLFLLFLDIIYPLHEVENIKLSCPTSQSEIFIDYTIDNFSQRISGKNDTITVEIESSDFLEMDLDFRIVPNTKYIEFFNPEVQNVLMNLIDTSLSLKDYLNKVSTYLGRNIRYSEEKLPQDAASVIHNRQASCIGFCNVTQFFLNAASIENHPAKGFYLQKGKKNTLIPIPHRWIEICLSNGQKFFYDPQFQKFSADYITTRENVDFKRIKKFTVYVIEKSKKIIN